MVTWPAKDPEAVADYLYTIPLDEGDTVESHVFERLSGTVTIDSESRSGADVTAWLSGGADGETGVFRVSWVTTGGRELDDIITLAVAANEPAELALTGHARPSAAHLVARYPAFASVSPATIRTWLTDAERFVDTSWPEADYAAALMALAAHNMELLGIGSTSGAGGLPAGVTRFKSGSMDVSISEDAAAAGAKGGYASTVYGREFALLQRRSFGGPRVIVAGVAPACGAYGYPQGAA